MSIYDNKQDLLKFLGINENFLYGNFKDKFGKIIISKRSGGLREINPPHRKLKQVEHVILEKILKKAEYLPCVYGLSKEKDIAANARFHQLNHDGFLLNLDISNFFPSIPYREVTVVFQRLGFCYENSRILTKLCTFNGGVPQGSPTSSHLACLCLEKMDKQIYRYCRSQQLIYTRYIDDISISGKSILVTHRNKIVKLIEMAGYCVNDKEKLMLPSDTKVINGITFTKTELMVSDTYKFEIKKLYELYRQSKNPLIKMKYIGKLGFFIFINNRNAKIFKSEIER